MNDTVTINKATVIKNMKTYAIIFLTAFLAAFIPQKSEIEPLYYIDVTDERLPVSALEGLSMDARFADANGDGRPDIIIANEFRPNILLINNGKGFFTDESDARLPRSSHDSEDIAAYDFDGDGDIDILIVSEDDQKNEFYINDGKGFLAMQATAFRWAAPQTE